MSALPTWDFVAMVGGIIAASAPIPPDAISAWIRRAVAGAAPDIAALSVEELEDLVLRTVLARCLVEAAEKHGAGSETREQIFGALCTGEPAPSFVNLARELGVTTAVLSAAVEAAYVDATGEVIVSEGTVH